MNNSFCLFFYCLAVAVFEKDLSHVLIKQKGAAVISTSGIVFNVFTNCDCGADSKGRWPIQDEGASLKRVFLAVPEMCLGPKQACEG